MIISLCPYEDFWDLELKKKKKRRKKGFFRLILYWDLTVSHDPLQQDYTSECL